MRKLMTCLLVFATLFVVSGCTDNSDFNEKLDDNETVFTARDFIDSDRPNYTELIDSIYSIDEFGERTIIPDPSIEDSSLLIDGYRLVGIVEDVYVYYKPGGPTCLTDIVQYSSDLGNGFSLFYMGGTGCMSNYMLVKGNLTTTISARNASGFDDFDIPAYSFCKVGYCMVPIYTIVTEE